MRITATPIHGYKMVSIFDDDLFSSISGPIGYRKACNILVFESDRLKSFLYDLIAEFKSAFGNAIGWHEINGITERTKQ